MGTRQAASLPDAASWKLALLGWADSFVAAGAHVGFFIDERFLVQGGRLVRALVFPGGDIREVLVIPLRLAVGRLELLAEMPAAGLAAVQRVQAKQLGALHEVRSEES